MIRRLVRFASFLAPALTPVYEFISRYIGARLDVATEFVVGQRYEQLAYADVSFVCGLAYIELCGRGRLSLTPIAAPVLHGERYKGLPIYFSDVVVRRDSPYFSFDDLEGARWSYNEPLSQSGYGITRYHLVRNRRTHGYFAEVIEAGYHARSIEMVRAGTVDASAIDSHVLALALREIPSLVDDLRIIASLGPSTIQPIVAGEWLPGTLREEIRQTLVEMALDYQARTWLAHGLIERFVHIDDKDYNDLRRMRRRCARAKYLGLR
jgi:phosphonate transport system substrate-binding protein